MEDLDNMVIPTNWIPTDSMIKVIGVGGGGVNAVSYMYNQHIEGCTFIVCNTDKQSLDASQVPVKIQLGQGRGAGCKPEKARKCALESQDEIAAKVMDNGTEMLFITAGMGGGTGTGAAPVIASMAKERGILTVAVITLPFKNEGNESMSRAIDGIHELQNNVDSLLIINNEKLYDFYGDELIQNAFPKTDEILATAVRGVVDIIRTKGFVNIDFEDVKNMMRDSGMALMGCGTGKGEKRVEDAIRQALESPLLNDCDLTTAKNTLINITAGFNDKGLLMTELNNIDKLIEQYTGKANRFKRGIVYNYEEGFDKIDITVIVTGFKMSLLNDMTDVSLGNLIIVEPDFVYNEEDNVAQEIEAGGDEQEYVIIGANTNYNVRHFNFTESNRPALAVRPGEDRSKLEKIPAITRRAPRP